MLNYDRGGGRLGLIFIGGISEMKELENAVLLFVLFNVISLVKETISLQHIQLQNGEQLSVWSSSV
ncbi:MAG: hypothetical protein IT280_05120 [Ignavibacteria bacterium]|nr:hypothetical protein [Ignavibacteria bacterium]